MLTVHPRFVVDEKARTKAVVVSLGDWRRLMKAVEELEDIVAYDKAKLKREAAIPFEQAVRRIKTRARR